MARVELAPGVIEDFDRFLNHLLEHEVEDAGTRLGQIGQALQVLTHSPLIGRPVGAGLRELVIGQGSRGYVALYRHVPALDTCFVLALRAQREQGYTRGL